MVACIFGLPARIGGDQWGDPYIGQVDAFAVYCAELDASFLVPIEDIRARQVAALRIDAPANGQSLGIRWASRYVLRSQTGAKRHGWLRAAYWKGAEDGIRTRDPLLGKQMRYHCATSATGDPE
jgi:PD-(D/E)XK endonuclease